MLLIVLLVVFLGAILLNRAVQAKNESEGERLVPRTVCPPHKWRHHEVKDKQGNIVAWQLACDRCGPLRLEQ